MSTVKLDPFQVISAVQWPGGESDLLVFRLTRGPWESPYFIDTYWECQMTAPRVGEKLIFGGVEKYDPGSTTPGGEYGRHWSPYIQLSNSTDHENMALLTGAFSFDLAYLRQQFPLASEVTFVIGFGGAVYNGDNGYWDFDLDVVQYQGGNISAGQGATDYDVDVTGADSAVTQSTTRSVLIPMFVSYLNPDVVEVTIDLDTRAVSFVAL